MLTSSTFSDKEILVEAKYFLTSPNLRATLKSWESDVPFALEFSSCEQPLRYNYSNMYFSHQVEMTLLDNELHGHFKPKSKIGVNKV